MHIKVVTSSLIAILQSSTIVTSFNRSSCVVTTADCLFIDRCGVVLNNFQAHAYQLVVLVRIGLGMIQSETGVKERHAEKQAGDILGDLTWLFPGCEGGRKHLLQTDHHPVLLGRHVPQGGGVVETTSLHYTLNSVLAAQPIVELISLFKMTTFFTLCTKCPLFSCSWARMMPSTL